MGNTNKQQERAELHKTIWGIANELNFSIYGWDFKQYVLVMLFYRYISENLTNYINKGERDSGFPDFDYKELSDEEAETIRESIVEEKGFFILPSELFVNIKKNAKNDDNLNETLQKVFINIENSTKGSDSESDFKGLFDDLDVNSKKLGDTVIKRNEKLVKLLNGIDSMKAGDYQDNSIDAFGDVYEYLMGMYALNDGQRGGEYNTPQEVSELLTKITLVGKTEVNKVYDPACGTGSLLLNYAKILGKGKVRKGFFGQEINHPIYNLCRINMLIHDIGYDKFDIALDDTLTNPQHWNEKPFDVIVSNPPYSMKWEGNDNPILINDARFSPAGILAPKSKADFAFIMHSLSWLDTDGTAAIVCLPGILYRGGAEKLIRKYLIDNNFIDCIIQLPTNLFLGTSIATCIMVLKKSKKDNNTLFIDASDCYKNNGEKKLAKKIVDVKEVIKAYISRKDIEKFSCNIQKIEIQKNDYDLHINKYIDKYGIKFQNERLLNLDQNSIKIKIGDLLEDSARIRDISKNSLFIPKKINNNIKIKLDITEIKPKNYIQIKFKDDISNEYMDIFFKTDYGKSILLSVSSKSNFGMININDLKDTEIVIPRKEERKTIIRIQEKLRTIKSKINKFSNELATNPLGSTQSLADIDRMYNIFDKLTESDKIRAIIRDGESKTVEFKETLSLDVKKNSKEKYIVHSALKTVVAFLNTDGGVLLIGVNDRGLITGLDKEIMKFHKNNDDELLKYWKNLIKDYIGESFYDNLDWKLIIVEEKKLLEVSVKASKTACYYEGTDFFVRTNPATDKLVGPKLVEYVQNHFQKT